MTTVPRGPAVVLISLGLLLLAVPAFAYVGDTEPGRLDRWIQPSINAPAAFWPGALMVDRLGGPAGRAISVLVVTALCLLANRRRLAVTAVVGMVGVTALSTVLKYIVGRKIHDGFLSYPSGHTAAVAAICLVLGLLLTDVLKLGQYLGLCLVLVLTLLGGGLMAYVQTDLTAHYPTDTIGGIGCALLVVPVTALLIDRFLARR